MREQIIINEEEEAKNLEVNEKPQNVDEEALQDNEEG